MLSHLFFRVLIFMERQECFLSQMFLLNGMCQGADAGRGLQGGQFTEAEELERAQLNHRLHSVDLKLWRGLQGVEVLVQHRRQDFEMRLGFDILQSLLFLERGNH
jgi:hypothetical protein